MLQSRIHRRSAGVDCGVEDGGQVDDSRFEREFARFLVRSFQHVAQHAGQMRHLSLDDGLHLWQFSRIRAPHQ